MIGDARGFNYPLEAVRRRAAWQLETSRGELAKTLRDIDARTRELRALDREHALLAAHAAPSAMGSVDPTRVRRLLVYLADMRHRMRDLQEVITSMTVSRDALDLQCRQQQLKVDAIERHRDDALKEHVAQSNHQQAIEADQDWLAQARCRQLHRNVHHTTSQEPHQ